MGITEATSGEFDAETVDLVKSIKTEMEISNFDSVNYRSEANIDKGEYCCKSFVSKLHCELCNICITHAE